MKNKAFNRITVYCTTAAMALSLSAPAFAAEDETASTADPSQSVETQLSAELPAAAEAEGESIDGSSGPVFYLASEFETPEYSQHEIEAESILPEPEEDPAEDIASLSSEAETDEELFAIYVEGEQFTESVQLFSANPEPETAAAATVSVGGVALGTENNASGWNGTSGWHYTGGEVNTVTIVNCDTVPDLHAEGTGFNITAAGLNHIGTLYADADVNITGTGILLIDKIDMLQGTQLNLLTNTAMYDDGSAAVFLLNSEDGCYYLIDGTVPGILDENYVIPDNVKLVVPADMQLDMRVTDMVITETIDENGNKTIESHYGIRNDDGENIGGGGFYLPSQNNNTSAGSYTRLEITFPTLTISQNSVLTIAEGASVNMGTTGYKSGGVLHDVATIIVNGVLELFGNIFGTKDRNEIPEVNIESSGAVTGSGVISQADIEFRAALDPDTGVMSNINLGDGSRLILNGSAPTQITLVEGSAELWYQDGASINDLVLPQETGTDSLTLQAPTKYPTLTVNGKVTGALGCIEATMHSIVNSTGALLLNQDYMNRMQQSREVSSDGTEICIALGEYNYQITDGAPTIDGGVHGGKYAVAMEELVPVGETLGTLKLFAQQNYSFSSLVELIEEKLQANKSTVLRVYLTRGDGVEAVILSKSSTEQLSAADILGIDLLHVLECATTEPSNSAVSTSGSNTGSGILGGENAGVLNGGGSTPVLPGTRQPAPSTDPEQPPETPETPEVPASQKGGNVSVVVRITETGTHRTAEILLNGKPVDALNTPVSATFPANLPADWDTDSLFAVFFDANGDPIAVKLSYDAATGTCSMLLPCSGEFEIVCLKWSGTDYSSPEFLAALKARLKTSS